LPYSRATGSTATLDGSKNSLLALAMASLVGSGVAVFWSVCMHFWCLPETDGAYGQFPFANPIVIWFSGFSGFIAWLLTFCVSAFTLRRAPITSSFLCILGAALVTITVATPFLGFIGTLASIPVTLGGLVCFHLKYR
jgi:hypothetical protein